MSGRVHKSRIPIRLASSLPPDAREALIDAKDRLRTGIGLEQFGNQRGAYEGDGSPLPQLSAGCVYYEFQVGESRDAKPTAGKKRFVIEFQQSCRRVMEVYYTENHYLKFSFFRIV